MIKSVKSNAYASLNNPHFTSPPDPHFPRSPRHCMNDSNSSNCTSSRPTLKLKAAPRKSREDRKPVPTPRSNSKLKPGAQWSDEYKSRMQADMDALTRR